MPFLTGLQHGYNRYVEVNGCERPSACTWNPTFIPDPLEESPWWLSLLRWPR